MKNEFSLEGNAGRDAEVKMSKTGMRIVSFSIAETTKGYNGDGNTTTWYDVTCFENERPGSQYLCDNVARVKKGSRVLAEGKFSLRKYQTKDGVEKWSPSITAHSVWIIEKAPSASIGDVPF